MFPALSRLALLVPLLDGIDRLALVDLPRALDAAAREIAALRDAATARDGTTAHDAGTARDSAAARASLASPATDADILARLEPARRDLARRIHDGSGGRVDPRAVAGYWDVASRYRLLVEDDLHLLRVTRRGRGFGLHPAGRVARHLAGCEGLLHLLVEVAAGRDTLAALLPGWRAVLAGNRRFAASASWPRSLGQRTAALVHDGLLAAHGGHASRLADEAGFRRREAEPAFADLDGGLVLTEAGRAWIG